MGRRTERLEFIITAREQSFVAGMKKVDAAVASTGAAAAKTSARVDKTLKNIDKSFASASKRIQSSVLSIQNVFAGLLVGKLAIAPIKFAKDFELQLANVDTLLKGSEVSIGRYKDQLLALSTTSSKQLIDLTKGLYQAISAGIPKTEGAAGAMAVLTAAQKAAVAGLSTTEQAVDTFATVLNSYKESALSAADVSDKLFTTVRIGRTTFPQLSSSLGRVTTVAAQFGISLDETLAAFAALTKAGLSTDEAATQLRSTILGLGRPSDRARKGFDKLGIKLGEAAFKSKGLLGIMKELNEKTGGSADAFGKLFPNIRALVGAMVLASGNAKGFAKDVQDLGESAGATDNAYKKIAATFNETFEIFKSNVAVVLQKAGEVLLPRLTVAFKEFSEILIANQGEIVKSFVKFFETLVAIGVWVKDNGATVLKFFIAMKASFLISGALLAVNKLLAAIVKLGAGALGAGKAGATMGAKFAGGFKVGIASLSKGIVGALTSPSILFAVAALGLLIGESINDARREEIEKYRAEVKLESKKIKARGQSDAEKRGFANEKENTAAAERVRRGQAFDIGPKKVNRKQTTLKKENVKSPDELIQKFGFEGALEKGREKVAEIDRGIIEDTILETSILRRLKTNKERVSAAESNLEKAQANKAAQRRGPEFEALEAEAAAATAEIRARKFDVATLEAQKRKVRQGIKADRLDSSKVLKSITDAEAVRERKRNSDEAIAEAGRIGRENAKKLSRQKQARSASNAERKKARKDLQKFILSADRDAIDGLRTVSETEVAIRAGNQSIFEDETNRRIELLKGEADEALNIALIQNSSFEKRKDLSNAYIVAVNENAEKEIELTKKTSGFELTALRENLDKQLAISGFSAEERLLVEEAFQVRKLKLEAETNKAITENAVKAAKVTAEEVEKIKALQRAKDEANLKIAIDKDPLSIALRKTADFDPSVEGLLSSLAPKKGDERGPDGELKTATLLAENSGPIGAIVAAVVDLPNILDGIATFLESGIDTWVTGVVEGFGRVLQGLAKGLPDQIVRLIGEGIPKLINAFFSMATAEYIPKLLAEWVLIIPLILNNWGAEFFNTYIGKAIEEFFVRFFNTLGDMIVDLIIKPIAWIGEQIIAALEFLAEGGEEAVTFVGRTFGIGALAALAGEKDFEASDIPIIGGLIGLLHQGGPVTGGSSPAMAGAMSAMGSPRFAEGGPVEAVTRRLRQQLNAPFADDVPALLQVGEAVLSRRGVAAAGGQNQVASMNRGNQSNGGAPSLIIQGRDRAVTDLLTALIQNVSIGMSTPGTALNASKRDGLSLGSVPVLGRGRF